ncbi:tau 95 subunit of transcription factor TFIIIC [Serendipita sp. 397]|nr:tau 95 subunit of transcription factor TFIIIC [Serendipita sp. 397]
MFTRYDMPMNYNFKQNSSLVRQNIIDKETGERSTRLVHASKIHDGSILAIKWGEPTPLECGPEREPLRALVRPDLLRKLEMLFERRPVWTRQGILNQLEDDEVRTMHSNRPIWSICSYVFHDGPWRDSVLRLGYDPRQDPEAYKYQIVSIRNQRNSTTRPSVLQSASQSAGSRRDRLSHQFDGVHVRTGGTFQLCDITDPLTRKVIDAPENRLQTCNEKDGYLTNAASSRIKALVKFKHQRLCDTGNAPEDEECTDFLLPDEEFLGVVRKYSTDRRQRKRSKAKGPDIEEEKVARRLERLVSRMETD